MNGVWRHCTGHVCAVDDDGVVHAMSTPLCQWTACTVDGVGLVIVTDDFGAAVTLRWAPRVASLPDGLTRCRECMEQASTRELVDWPPGADITGGVLA